MKRATDCGSSSMRIVPSPFTNRTTITAPEDFVGREEELAAILGRLRTLQSSSIVGERRIGKSSLLYHLAQTGRAKLGEKGIASAISTCKPRTITPPTDSFAPP